MRSSGEWVAVKMPSRTFPVRRGRPFVFQNKGCGWVTDIDAGRGIGTDNRSAGGGSLKQIQSDLGGVLEQRTPALRSFGLAVMVNEHRREAPRLQRRA